MFTKKDLKQFRLKGISLETIESQLEHFRKGFPPVVLESPAVPGNGIIQPSQEESERYIAKYESERRKLNIVKFVPASGAASRMFKDLFGFLERASSGKSEIILLEESGFIREFIDKIEKFAFTKDLKEILQRRGTSIDRLVSSGNISEILKCVLEPEGLGYGNLPKGLIKFHNYSSYTRTAFEEHLVEGVDYALSADNHVMEHMTVSPEFRNAFGEHFKRKKSNYEDIFSTSISVDFSVQKPSTDTIAVDPQNNPFRNEQGDILFRPGGHGALLENLNEIDADIIFIKNIDNVAPDSVKKNTNRFKKLIAGILLDYQEKIFNNVRIIEEQNPGKEFLIEICNFLRQGGCRLNKKELESLSDDKIREKLLTRLQRPVRICGMVKNEGEPGGGPFWVLDEHNNSSLQIVETSQIDLSDYKQKEILNRSTHFNPVDLVCGVKDRKGQKYDLLRYTDPNTGFISEKSSGGRPVKAQELPGLWNGAMANWNTLFVEVPIETFTPVKTINDLLRPEHQA
jgi:Domain of unknown function (DUF4301)